MTELQLSAEKKVITGYIHKIILFWLEDKLSEVEYLIDNDVIICVPIESIQLKGREHFIEYLKKARHKRKVIRYNEEDFSIHINDSIAMAHYKFVVEYEQNVKRHIDSGRDFLIFKRQNKDWKLIWLSIDNFK